MSTFGERKCALLLSTLGRSDRRRLLRRLPPASASSIRALVRDLDAMRLPLVEAAEALLGDEMAGLTAATSPDLDQLMALASRLSPAWFARVLSAWGGVDRSFCLAMLDRKFAQAVERESATLCALPPKLADALRAEASVMASVRRAA